MSGLRILLLRATRLVRRAPVRSMTTGLLVMAAVLAGTLWLSTARGNYQADYSAESQFGQADVRYGLYPTGAMSNDDGPVPNVPVADQVDAVLAALPDDADTAVLESFDGLRLGNVAISDPLTVHQGPWGDPLLRGLVDLADGRLPGPGEVVVSPELAASAGLDLGDDLAILDPPAVMEVVGLGSTTGPLGLLVAPGEFVVSEPEMADLVGTAGPQGSASVLATLPAGVDPPQVPIGDSSGDGQIALPFTRDDLFDNAPTRTPVAIVVLVIAFVAVSAGAAFAIGAARRRRALGLLASNGATPAQLRLAAGTEALVVSVPAVALGAGAAIAVPFVWVQLRLPGWDRIWQVDVSPGWVALLALAAVAAAVLGTIVFSGSITQTSVPALLDQRSAVRRPTTTRPRRGTWVFVLVVVAALFALPLAALLTSRSAAIGASVGVLLTIAAWGLGALAVVVFARWVLARHAVGRLVGRDLARRPLGTGAAVAVVAVWSFAAVVWALTAGIGGEDFDEAASQAGPPAEAEPVTGTITIEPAPTMPLRHRSSAAGDGPAAVPDQLRDRLAALGLDTRWATVGQFTGDCPVCPGDYRPTVMVLDSVDGLGLPARTEEALRAGSAVTAFDLDGVDGATIGGLPVTVAPLPLVANAAMLAEFSPPGGTPLANQTEVLVGSTTGLSDAAAADVVLELADAGVTFGTDDPRVQPVTTAEANGLGLDVGQPVDREPLWWALSVVALALVTMAATVAHRREHGEAAHVLWVLGAGPGAGRQLAALTAGTIATVGVLIGSTTAAAVVAAIWVNRADLDLADVIQTRRVLTVLAVVVVVPAAAMALGRLLPAPRSVRADVRPA